MRTRIRAVMLIAGIAFAAGASAQAYPSRPIKFVVPFPPGGNLDFLARTIQPRLSEALGATIVVDNRGGAAGIVGAEYAARQPGDGYTLFLGNTGSSAINPSIFPSFPVRPLRDLVGLTLLVDVPGAFAVHPSVPANSVKEFIDYAKARPGQLNYGSSGSGSAQRLAFEFFMQKAGIKLVHIPYKGGAGAATLAVLAGEVNATMLTVASFVGHVKSGKAKVLAVMSPARSHALPQVPTMAESGFPELKLGSWQAMFVPKGTPRPIVNKLYGVMIKTMEDPETMRRLAAGGADIVTSKSPDEFAAFLKEQTEFWAKIVKSVGATAE